MDINTNPKNPIISTRAFGEDAETVSFFGYEMIKIFQANGIIACGKHFPGHGDTEIDSHINLPVINKNLKALERTELVPFRNAIKAGVKMIMLGHLSVPALDPSGIPISLSKKAIRYLRDKMGFKGLIITDALNMHALYPPFNSPLPKGGYRGVEEKASLMALRAGVDLLLHPTDPERVVSYLEKSNLKLKTKNLKLRTKINSFQFSVLSSQFEEHRRLSEELTRKAIRIEGDIRPLKKPLLIILNDKDTPSPIPLPRGEGAKGRVKAEGNPPSPPFNSPLGKGGYRGVEGGMKGFLGDVFAERLKEKFPDLKLKIVKSSSMIHKLTLSDNASVIVAIFSAIKAWKGGPSHWLLKCIKALEGRVDIFISFGSPYILPSPTPLPHGEGVRGRGIKIYAYWDSEIAQRAVAELI